MVNIYYSLYFVEFICRLLKLSRQIILLWCQNFKIGCRSLTNSSYSSVAGFVLFSRKRVCICRFANAVSSADGCAQSILISFMVISVFQSKNLQNYGLAHDHSALLCRAQQVLWHGRSLARANNARIDSRLDKSVYLKRNGIKSGIVHSWAYRLGIFNTAVAGHYLHAVTHTPGYCARMSAAGRISSMRLDATEFPHARVFSKGECPTKTHLAEAIEHRLCKYWI